MKGLDIRVKRPGTNGHVSGARPAALISMSTPFAAVPMPRPSPEQEVRLSHELHTRLLDTTTAVHAAGLKSFGLLLASPTDRGFPYVATDVAFFDPTKNRRNDPAMRTAFEAQGEYFRSYDDAGFVADATELLEVYRRLDEYDLEAVALFHVHRRQPANFSHIDFRLHNPAYAWHLIVSLRDPAHPVLRPFAVRKDLASEFGISADDRNEGSEKSYAGPEVAPLRLVVDTADEQVTGRLRS
jgi:proteasome lid subunit RPN8/RPN11